MKLEDFRACYLIERTFDKGNITITNEKTAIFHQWVVLDEQFCDEGRVRKLYAIVEDDQGYVSIVEHPDIRFAYTPAKVFL